MRCLKAPCAALVVTVMVVVSATVEPAATVSLAVSPASLIDAHCHLQLDMPSACKHLMAPSSGEDSSFPRVALMATQPADWAALGQLEREFPERIAATSRGVHPWFAHRVVDQQGWIDALRASVEASAHPTVIIGEIGVDKSWKPRDTGEPTTDAQEAVFAMQFDLATELQLPVSVHVVRRQGFFLDFVRSRAPRLPPAIFMHSFGGSAECAGRLLRTSFGSRVFFGFSAAVNLRSPRRARQVIPAVPEDRLLLESDLESAGKVGDDLLKMLEFMAAARGTDVTRLASVTSENAKRFYGLEVARADGATDGW